MNNCCECTIKLNAQYQNHLNGIVWKCLEYDLIDIIINSMPTIILNNINIHILDFEHSIWFLKFLNNIISALSLRSHIAEEFVCSVPGGKTTQ